MFADRKFIGEQWFTWLIGAIVFCIRVKNFIVTRHLGRRIIKLVIYFAILKLVKLNVVNDGFWIGRVKLYISALQLENGELLLVVSLSLVAMLFRIMHYAEIETLFSCLKDAGLILKIRA